MSLRLISMFKSFGYGFNPTPEGWELRLLDGTELLVAHDKMNDWLIKQTASAISENIHRAGRNSRTTTDGITDAPGLLVVHEHVRRAGA